jgi:hypothetical protein
MGNTGKQNTDILMKTFSILFSIFTFIYMITYLYLDYMEQLELDLIIRCDGGEPGA